MKIITIIFCLIVLTCYATLSDGYRSGNVTAVQKRSDDDDDVGDYSDYYENYEGMGEGDGEDGDDDEMGQKELMGRGLTSLKNLGRGINNVDAIRKNTKLALTKIAGALQKMGPALKAVGFLVSLINMFLKDEEESKELKFMKEKFTEVNAKLDIITNKLDDIENAIEYQGAKMSFGKYVRKIRSLRRNLQFALDSKSTLQRNQNRDVFMEAFMASYDDAAMVLYEALMGQDQSYFGYDLLEVTSQKFKCNVNKMTDLCVVVSRTLVDALTVEGAYFGFRQMSWRIQEEGDLWKQRMGKVGKRCQSYLNKCADDWKKFSEPVFNTAYNKKYKSKNAELADHIFKALSDNVPQRAWGVFVYDDTWGFNTHTVTKVNDHSFVRWHKNGKIVTVCSADLRSSRFTAKKVKEVMDKAVKDIRSCARYKPGDPALRLVNGMQKSYGYWPGGCMYAVEKGKHLEVRATKNHVATRDVSKSQQCSSKITRYNLHMYIFN